MSAGAGARRPRRAVIMAERSSPARPSIGRRAVASARANRVEDESPRPRSRNSPLATTGRTKLRVLFDIVLVPSAFWAAPGSWRPRIRKHGAGCGTGRRASHRGRLWSEGSRRRRAALAYPIRLVIARDVLSCFLVGARFPGWSCSRVGTRSPGTKSRHRRHARPGRATEDAQSQACAIPMASPSGKALSAFARITLRVIGATSSSAAAWGSPS